MNSFSQCPTNPEEAAEERLLNRMSKEDAAAFDAHLSKCPKCLAVFEATREYIKAVRAAAKRLKDEDPGRK